MIMKPIKLIQGSVTAPSGFSAAGCHVGIKKKRPDMALLVSDQPATAAGVFTTNQVNAAPVKLCREHVKYACKGILVNSGNANACTGQQGMQDARDMAVAAAEALSCKPENVLVCSTGTIGVMLPMDTVKAGIPKVAAELQYDAGEIFAKAIMTTDAYAKHAACELDIDGTTIRIGIAAKGAGMIEPNMATMLAYITTDAQVDVESLHSCLKHAVDKSFNRISVDGDQSTNDTVLFLANGAAGGPALSTDHPGWGDFCSAVEQLCMDMAIKIVADGEGATKCVRVEVHGARNDEDARTVARTVARSLLVKTSWFGCDPNWGRVIDAVGYSGAEIDENKVDIGYDDCQAVLNGMRSSTPLSELETVLKQDSFTLKINLNLGQGSWFIYGCDCGYEYVRINSEYTT
jgi:glutamate N-acetyltransferase/amino-acid N-acetyltransferase